MPRPLALLVPATLAATLLTGCPGESSAVKAPAEATAQAAPTAPAKTPVKAPEPAKPFVREELKTPWKLAKKGDWAVYTMHLPSGDKTFRFEVTDVAERTVTFVRSDPKTGKSYGEETVDLAKEDERYTDPRSYDALDGEPTTQPYELKGKQLEVLVVKRKKEGFGSTELWLAEQDVRPFMQCAVKSLKNDKLESELVDFGSADSK